MTGKWTDGHKVSRDSRNVSLALRTLALNSLDSGPRLHRTAPFLFNPMGSRLSASFNLVPVNQAMTANAEVQRRSVARHPALAL
jgi:hypothetical protein